MAQAYRSNTLAGALTRLRRRCRVLAITAWQDGMPRTPRDVVAFLACSAFWLLLLFAWGVGLGGIHV